MRSFMKFSTAAAVALLSVAGCKVMHHEESTGQYVDDTTLTARAKAALIKDKAVSSSDYSVEVYQGDKKAEVHKFAEDGTEVK